MSKLVVLVLLVIAIQCSLQAPEGHDKKAMKEKFKKCFELLSDENKTKLKGGEWPDSEDVKKYSKCLLVMFGAMKEDGTYNEENIKKYLEKKLGSKEKGNELYEKCVKTGGSAEESAFNTIKCFKENGLWAKKKSEE